LSGDENGLADTAHGALQPLLQARELAVTANQEDISATWSDARRTLLRGQRVEARRVLGGDGSDEAVAAMRQGLDEACRRSIVSQGIAELTDRTAQNALADHRPGPG